MSKTIALLLGKGIGGVAIFAIAIILSRALNKADYGTFQLGLNIFTYSAPILAAGLPASLLYFVSKDVDASRRFLVQTLTLLFIIGLTFAFILTFCAPGPLSRMFGNPELKNIIPIIGIYGAFAILVLPLGPFLIAVGKVGRFALHALFFNLILVGSISFIVIRGQVSPVNVAWIMAGVTMVAAFIGIALMYFSASGAPKVRSFSLVVNQLKFAVPLGLATSIEILALGVDRIIVAILTGPEEYAVFVNGSFEIPFIGLITGTLFSVAMPSLVKFVTENNRTAALELWKKQGRTAALVLLPLGGFLFLIAPALMVLLFGYKYTESAYPFRIYLLLLPARVVVFGVLFQACNKNSVIFKRSIGTLLLNAVATVILVKTMGLNGAPLGTVLVFWIYVIPVCIYWTSRIMNVSWKDVFPFSFVLKVLGVVVGGVLLCWHLIFNNVPVENLSDIFIQGGVFFAITSIALWSLLRKEIPSLVDGVLKK